MAGSLMYFPLRARGEAIMMLAAHARLDLKYEFIHFSSWPELKPKMPGGTLPILRLPSGELTRPHPILKIITSALCKIIDEPVNIILLRALVYLTNSLIRTA